MSYFHAIYGQGGSPEPTPSNDHPPVLLWTNSAPSNEFGAQTIELDLSGYVGVIVESIGDAGYDFMSSRDYIKKDDTIAGDRRYMSIGSRCDIGDSGSIVRAVTALNNNGITFGAAKQGTSVRNDTVIPYKIYGVQEYVVEENAGGNVYYLGTGTSFDIKTLVPDVDYAKLTADNFIAGCNSSGSTPRENKRPGNVEYEWVQAEISSVNISYDNSTGVLSLNGGVLSVRGGGSLSVYNKDAQLPIFAYLVVGNIITI